MTNYEKIKSMSIEEITDFLFEYAGSVTCENCYLNTKCKFSTSCIDTIRKWLENEVNENE